MMDARALVSVHVPPVSMCHRQSYAAGMARREELTVRFNAEERAAIDRRAEVDGVSAAAVLRMLVRKHLKVEQPAATKKATKRRR